MLKSLKQFAKKLSGGSKRTRKVSQKGGVTKAERTKKANSYMKMLLLKQEEARQNKIAETKAKRSNQNKQNLARAMKAHQKRRNKEPTKPQNNVLNQYNSSTYQPTERAAVKWGKFNENFKGNLYNHVTGRNTNNRVSPTQNQLNEANQYKLRYAQKYQQPTYSQLYGNHTAQTSGLYLNRKSRKSSPRKSSRSPSPATNN